MMERTLAIIKPDAFKAHHSGAIIDRIEREGFGIVDMKMLTLSKSAAEEFYAIHKERPFFSGLVNFMISGPVIVLALEKENAVKAWRTLMGATNPAQAEANTIRKLFGTSIDNNATHGSDSIENGKAEVAFFFPHLRS